MKKDWAFLTKLTGDRPISIERVAIESEGVAIEGCFELPPLTKLRAEDQVFAAVFIKCHGSIKEMEKHFGISYPTVKNRLNRLAQQLDFVKVETVTNRSAVLTRLESGEISVDQAVAELRGEMLGE